MTEHDETSEQRSSPTGDQPVARWTDAELDELLGVHALDAIDDEAERDAVEAYVARSPRARAELDSHRHVASAIGNSVVAAPNELWERIADKIGNAGAARTPMAAVATAPRGSNDAVVAVPTSEPAPPKTKQRSRLHRGRVRPMGSVTPSTGSGFTTNSNGVGISRPWAAAAAVVVAFAVGSTATAINRNSALQSAAAKNQNLRANVAIERARSSQLRNQLNDLRKTSPVALRLAQLENDPSARNVQLVSTSGKALGHVLLASDGEGYIVGDTLPTLPIGRTYQLWGVKDDVVLSLGVLGRSPRAMPFAADERWSQLVLTNEASPGVVASEASAAAVATFDEA